MLEQRWVILAIATCLLRTASCSNGDLCYITAGLSALVGEELYFMGGNFSFEISGGQQTGAETVLYWLNVSNQYPVERSIPAGDLFSATIGPNVANAFDVASSGDPDKLGAHGALWQTNDTLYVYGSTGTANSELSAYSIATSRWSTVTVAGGPLNVGIRSQAIFASDPYSGLSFILGGNDTDTRNIGGMVRLDASNPEQLSWTNETLGNGSYGMEVPNFHYGGQMVYVPAGEEGILVAFGGFNISAGFKPNWGWPYYSDFSQISVYDIATHTWFLQTASGDIPAHKASFCSVVTAAPDNSAFYITVYGGYSLELSGAVETVSILELPSFTWIDATSLSYQTSSEAQLSKSIGRDHLNCQLYNNTLMLVLGGNIREDGATLSDGSCNNGVPPTRVLDLSTYQWASDTLALNTSYQVPQIISNVTGGNASGGATKTIPDAGFANPTLATIMKARAPTAAAKSSSASSFIASPTSTNPSSTEAQDSSNVGAIAGGVVGAVLALALIFAMIWYLLRRRRRQHSREYVVADGKMHPPDGPGELGGDAINELHAEHKPYESDATQVHELPGEYEPPVLMSRHQSKKIR